LKKFNLEPIGDRVVVKRKGLEEKTPGGIALPDAAQESPRIGTVVAVGPGNVKLFSNNLMPPTRSDNPERYPMQCRVGDRVLLPYTAEVIRLDPSDKDSDIVVCQESQLLTIIR
jgi:chaperonin GroES